MDEKTRQLYELKAQMIQAAAHPIRLAIIDYLANGEQCVCDIAEHVGAQRSNVSRHLSLMLNAGVLECRKEGLKMIYSLKTPCFVSFLDCVKQALRERFEDHSTLLSQLG